MQAPSAGCTNPLDEMLYDSTRVCLFLALAKISQKKSQLFFPLQLRSTKLAHSQAANGLSHLSLGAADR